MNREFVIRSFDLDRKTIEVEWCGGRARYNYALPRDLTLVSTEAKLKEYIEGLYPVELREPEEDEFLRRNREALQELLSSLLDCPHEIAGPANPAASALSEAVKFSSGNSAEDEREDQYVNGVLNKSNYTQASILYPVLLNDFRLLRQTPGLNPSTLSRNHAGKITAYFSDHDGSEFAKLREEFGIPDGDWGKTFSVSVHPNGEESVKVYDMDFSKYDIPELPKGAELGYGERTELGVASVWSKGSSGTGSGPNSDILEVFFLASREDVAAWAEPRGLTLPDVDGVSHWGITYLPDGTITKLKAMVWHPKVYGDVERCWVNGRIARTGMHRDAPRSKALLLPILPAWIRDRKDRITNIGANTYDLGEFGQHEIVSVYLDGEVGEDLREHFQVPADVVPAPWYGIKYCPVLGALWLKLADMRYDHYTLPPIPENAERAFGVATVYAENDSQPPVHNAESGGYRDCSFITRDHGAVRRWCAEHGVADPAPHLPDTLDLYGVYSITHHAETGEILRLKFYDYCGDQQFEMEAYLSAVMDGRAKGLEHDEVDPDQELIRDAYNRVLTFREKE